MNDKLIEGIALYLPAIIAMILWIVIRPHARLRIAILMTTLWQAALLPWLNFLAQSHGWWSFKPSIISLFGMPLTLYLGWVFLWGIIATLILGKLPYKHPLITTGILMLLLDLILMPHLEPVLQLGSDWLVGEFSLFLLVLVPGFALAHFTLLDQRPELRSLLISIAFVTLLITILPFIFSFNISERIQEIKHAHSPFAHLLFWALMISFAIPGISAVREFCTVGQGTPIPYDPPKTMVTSGVYSYLRNPMQFSMVGVLITWACYLKSPLTFILAIISIIYSSGLAFWSENKDLSERFGKHWHDYRQTIKPWLPRLTPGHMGTTATIYFDFQCRSCREVSQWFQKRHLTGLEIHDANQHPQAPLPRVTYEHANGIQVQGVEAISAALSHGHIGMAWFGWVLQIPGILTITDVAFAHSFASSKHSS